MKITQHNLSLAAAGGSRENKSSVSAWISNNFTSAMSSVEFLELIIFSASPSHRFAFYQAGQTNNALEMNSSRINESIWL